jgi:Rod binding domain-containing protein
MEAINTNQAMMAYQNSRSAPTVPQGADLKQIKKVAEDFEAFFLSQALQPMFANIEAEEPFGGGPGDDIWKSMQIDEFGKSIAKSGGIGIADAVMKQLLLAQENSAL